MVFLLLNLLLNINILFSETNTNICGIESKYWPVSQRGTWPQNQYLKSYVFQEIKCEVCFLHDEKYYLVNILNYCTRGQRLDGSLEAPSVLFIITVPG